MKDATNGEMPRRAVCKLRTEDLLIRLLFKTERSGNAGNWNILVPAGKEINWDMVSKSDWKLYTANRIWHWKVSGMWCFGPSFNPRLEMRSLLESSTKQGDSPVAVTEQDVEVSRVVFLGYGAWNWEALTSNCKYVSRPIANQYREGNVEKNPWQGVKRPWNLIGIEWHGFKELCRTFRITYQGVYLSSEVNLKKR